MPEDTTLSRTTGTAVLALAAVVCAAGLADVLRRRRGRTRVPRPAEPDRRHTFYGSPAIPLQRRTGPHAEAVQLTPAERDAFAVLVRRLSEDG